MRYLIILLTAANLFLATATIAEEDEDAINERADLIISLKEELAEKTTQLANFDEKITAIISGGLNNQTQRNDLKVILELVITIQKRLVYLGGQLAELRGTGPVKLSEFIILGQVKYFEPKEIVPIPVTTNDQITFTALLGFPKNRKQDTPLDTTLKWTLTDSEGQVVERYSSTSADQGVNPTDAREFILDPANLKLGNYVVSLTHSVNGPTPMSVMDDIYFSIEANEIVITELEVSGIDGGEPDLMGYYTYPKGVDNLGANVILMNTTTGEAVYQDQWAVDDYEAGEFAVEITSSMMEGDSAYSFTAKISGDDVTTAEKTINFTYVEKTDEAVWGEIPADDEGEATEGELSEDDEDYDEGESWEDADSAEDLTTGDEDTLSAYEMRNKLAQKAAQDAASDEARNARKFSQVEEGREEERIRKAEKRAAWGDVFNTLAAGIVQGAAQIQAADLQSSRNAAANRQAYSTGSAFSSTNAQSSAISGCVSRKNSAPSNGFARMDPHATQMECAQEYRNSRPAKKPATQQWSNNNSNTNRGNESNFDSMNYTGGNGGLNTGGNSRGSKPKPKTSFGDNINTDASNEYVPQKRVEEKPLPVGQFSKECDSSGITLYYWDSAGRGGRDKCLSDKQYGQSTAFKICGVTFYSTQRSVNYGLRNLKGSNPKYTGVYTKNSPDLNQCHGQ